MKKRILCIAAALIMTLCCLCACGEPSTPPDITSTWRLEQVTVNGKTVKFGVIKPDSLSPAFSCPDGKNVTFSNNGKSHKGVLLGENGVYTIDFEDSTKNMKAVISGDKLFLTIEGSDNTELVFKAK